MKVENVLKVEYVPIDSIKKYKRNAKLHPPEQIQEICESIRLCAIGGDLLSGFKDPIGIWHGEIVEGHGRYMAAQELGLDTVPIIRLDDMTDDQRRAYMLIHNQTTMDSGWDLELLDLELGDIELNLEPFGFDMGGEEEEPNEAIEDDYEPEPPAEPKAKRGDLYQLGRHRLMCGDSTMIDDVEKLMDGAKADMLFTDPPYGVDYASKNKYLNAISRGNRIQVPIENDALSAEEEKEQLWVPALSNARMCADDKCAYYIASPQGGELMMMMMAICEAGWQLKHTIIWNKNNHVLGRSDYNYKHEPILYGWNKQHNFYGNGKRKTSVWDIPKPQKSDLHPTMKPVELVAECIMNSTKEGDNVLDVFGGSGTTLMACEQLGRNGFMMEFAPNYVDVIIDRWEKFTGEKAVLLSRAERR